MSFLIYFIFLFNHTISVKIISILDALFFLKSNDSAKLPGCTRVTVKCGRKSTGIAHPTGVNVPIKEDEGAMREFTP